MAEATLAQDPWLPDFPPVDSMWLQPEGTLTFHSFPVKGIALFHLFKYKTRNDTTAQTSASGSADEEEEDAPSFSPFQQHWWCDILVEKEQQEKTTGARVMYSSLALGIYNGRTGRWEFGSSQQEECPTGLCQVEQLGLQTVYIPCASCEKELNWWGGGSRRCFGLW